MIVYNKLIRDRIPEVIAKDGKICRVRKVQDRNELLSLLDKKLDEEIQEFRSARNTEELADILEVVFALAENLGTSNAELLAQRDRKAEKRGGFREGLFLESVED